MCDNLIPTNPESLAIPTMSPDEAINRIIDVQKLVYGSFSDLFPDLTNLDVEARKNNLIRCVWQMEEVFKEISPFEVNRFMQEEETIILMAIIATWGCSSECLPFTDDDLNTIRGAMFASINGMLEIGEKPVYDIALRLLEQGIASGIFPDTVRQLLPTMYTDVIEDSE
jgi:hypothetical protein